MRYLDDLLVEEPWKVFFYGFTLPYAFLVPKEYVAILSDVRLKLKRAELFPKIMTLAGAEGLAGWMRTTWLPYTERLPVERQDAFVGEIVKRYLASHPVDAASAEHLNMVRWK